MGISDEEYAVQLEKLRADAAARLSSVTITTNVATTTGALHYPNNVSNREMRMRAEDLDHEAAKVPLEILKDMWVIRWQDKWVTEDEIRNADTFWRIAFVRLENVNRIEKHTLGDSYDKVYRIIE